MQNDALGFWQYKFSKKVLIISQDFGAVLHD
jgi:hypothetical protein